MKLMIQFAYSCKEGNRNMKKVKVLASVVSVAMIAGLFAGCSKTTTIGADKFIKACEKLKLEEADYDDSIDDVDYEDGVYACIGEDDIEDRQEELLDLLEEVTLDTVIDVEDVLSVGLAVKTSGTDDFEDIEDPEDLADVEAEGALAFQMTLADNYTEDIMEYFETKLDMIDVDVKDLSSKEYFSSKDEGYIRFNIDVAQLVKIVSEDDDLMDLLDEATGDAEDIMDSWSDLKGTIGFSVEVNANNVFIIAGGSLNAKADTLNSFCGAFGASCNPSKLPMNKDVVEDLVDKVADLAMMFAGYF